MASPRLACPTCGEPALGWLRLVLATPGPPRPCPVCGRTFRILLPWGTLVPWLPALLALVLYRRLALDLLLLVPLLRLVMFLAWGRLEKAPEPIDVA